MGLNGGNTSKTNTLYKTKQKQTNKLTSNKRKRDSDILNFNTNINHLRVQAFKAEPMSSYLQSLPLHHVGVLNNEDRLVVGQTDHCFEV